MVTNIDTLTDKIYQEGVVRAENEAIQIIEKAKQEAEELITDARRISDQIIEAANKEAAEVQQNAIADLKLAGNKAISTIKQEIKKLLHQKILDQPVEHLFSDENFLKELILAIAKNYSNEQMAVVLPEKLKEKFNEAMEGSMRKEVNGLKINFNRNINGGFQIARQDTNYLITFTDEDFIEFFKPFLNRKTEEILFKNGI